MKQLRYYPSSLAQENKNSELIQNYLKTEPNILQNIIIGRKEKTILCQIIYEIFYLGARELILGESNPTIDNWTFRFVKSFFFKFSIY